MVLATAHRVTDPANLATPLLIIPVPKGPLPPALAAIDAACSGELARCWASGDFGGGREESALLYPPGAIARVLLVGLGEAADVGPDDLRNAAMVAAKRARVIGVPEAALFHVPDFAPRVPPERAGQVLAEGLPFGAWHYPDLKRPPEVVKPVFAHCDVVTLRASKPFTSGFERGSAIAAGQAFTRELQILPGNSCTPAYLGSRATQLGKEHGFTVTVFDKAAIIREGMQALMAIAQGSAQDPRFIILEYRGSDTAPVVLVGKGVTFDSGGISIKPAQSMEDMKYDMSGAAAVLGAFEVLGRLRPAIHVVGLIPTCENMPSGTAVKPGDVVGSHFGKTIEVVNTDAEGRLILSDALSWARRYHPAAVIDAATLTGAVVIGLGHTATGVMGTDPGLIAEVIAAGEKAGERGWQLPLWDEYRELIKSDIADVKNSGGRPAGSITAGWFLREFVEGYPWAHLDIAGTAYSDRETATQVRGPTGNPVRLFAEFLLARA